MGIAISSILCISAALATSSGSLDHGPSVAAAQTAPNTAQGTVTFLDGSAAAGAPVSVRFGIGLSDIADNSGNYSIGGIQSGFAIIDAVVVSDGQTFSGTAFVGFAPGGGSTSTANIVVRPPFPGPFPPSPF